MAGVFGAVVVGVSDQRGFPVVVDIAVGDGYEVCGVGELFLVSCQSDMELGVVRGLRRVGRRSSPCRGRGQRRRRRGRSRRCWSILTSISWDSTRMELWGLLTDANSISICSEDLGNAQVANHNV